MIVAICAKCGDEKRGALSICSSCRTKPGTEEERATALSLSWHLSDASELSKFVRQIKRGNLVVPEARLAQARNALKDKQLPRTLESSNTLSQPENDASEYWYVPNGHDSAGPVSLELLKKHLFGRNDWRDVPVWKEGFDSWKVAAEIAEIRPTSVPPPFLPAAFKKTMPPASAKVEPVKVSASAPPSSRPISVDQRRRVELEMKVAQVDPGVRRRIVRDEVGTWIMAIIVSGFIIPMVFGGIDFGDRANAIIAIVIIVAFGCWIWRARRRTPS